MDWREATSLAIALLSLLPAAAAAAHAQQQRATRTPPSAVVELWVANPVTNHVVGFAASAEGNAAPLRTIGGDKTSLKQPQDVAVDPEGWIYVTNAGDNSVTVYAPNANGNVAPARIVRGPSTGLAEPRGLTIDSRGSIYVANAGRHRVTVHATGANGDARPERSIWGSRSGMDTPFGVAVDDTGTVYVASWYGHRLDVFAPHADGNVHPVRSIKVPSAFQPRTGSLSGVALGADGRIYATSVDYQGAILVFDRGASGVREPTRAIAGPRTGIATPTVLKVDREGRVAVSNWGPAREITVTVYDADVSGDAVPFRRIAGSATGLTWPPPKPRRPPLRQDSPASPSVTIYRPGAAGNAAPDRKIAGASTLLVTPVNLAVSPDGRPHVLSCQGRITVYASDADGDAAPTSLPAGRGLAPVGAMGLVLGGADTLFVELVASWRHWRGSKIRIYTSGLSIDDTTFEVARSRGSWWVGGLARHPDGRFYDLIATGFEVIDLEAPGKRQKLTGRDIGFFTPGLFAADSRGRLLVPNRDDVIRVYDATPTRDLRPIRRVSGWRTLLDDPVAVAVGPGDTIFVANAGGMHSKPRITVYAPGAARNSEPVRVLEGERTGMHAVKALAVDSVGTLYVLNNPQGQDGCTPSRM